MKAELDAEAESKSFETHVRERAEKVAATGKPLRGKSHAVVTLLRRPSRPARSGPTLRRREWLQDQRRGHLGSMMDGCSKGVRQHTSGCLGCWWAGVHLGAVGACDHRPQTIGLHFPSALVQIVMMP